MVFNTRPQISLDHRYVEDYIEMGKLFGWGRQGIYRKFL